MHLELVALVVDDYDRGIAFFVGVLGFELVEDSPATTNDGRPKRWVVVRPPGAGTALLLALADGERQSAVVGEQFAGRVGLFLRVEDFDDHHSRMLAAGVEFVTAPRVEPYGQVAVFRDIAGNRWDLLGPRPPRPEPWGAAKYGDPCRQCRFDWGIDATAAMQLVAETPERYAAMVDGADGSQRHPELGWDVTGYVCHVADNLRVWAERLVGASLGADGPVAGYDQDLLAAARDYSHVPLAGALWSLQCAARDWLEAVRLGLDHGVVLRHEGRGDLSVVDVARTNAHGVHHHAWDISRTLGTHHR